MDYEKVKQHLETISKQADNWDSGLSVGIGTPEEESEEAANRADLTLRAIKVEADQALEALNN